jgi:hypothetical protein
MRNLVRHLQDNAMLYKDITQWLRNRTFVALFFGLLMLAEGISVFVMSLGEDVTQPGPAVFYSLYTVLVVYALIIAFMGHSLTAREFSNRTFELYELSGMSLERMIGGKLLSMVYEFLFGFFCIVPFMFFAYFLGGLDFFELISGAILTLIAFLPLYLVTLQLALSTRLKQVSALGRVGAVFGLVIIVLVGLTSFFGRSPVTAVFVGASDVIKGVMLLNWRAIVQTLVFFLFYGQICLLLFYLCCNSISREADSRELPVKLLYFTIVLSWLSYRLYMSYHFGYGQSEPTITCVPIFLSLCLVGLMLYYNRFSVPQIIRKKYENATPPRRLLYFLFQPGMAGTVRLLILILATLCGFAMLLYQRAVLVPNTGGIPAGTAWMQALSLPLQVPFFLVIPFGFLLNLKNMRFNYGAQRTLVAMWWGVAGAVCASLVAWWNFHASAGAPAFEFAALLASPFSSAFGDLQAITAGAVWVRITTGVLGIILMVLNIFRIKRLQAQGVLPARATVSVADPTSASLAA